VTVAESTSKYARVERERRFLLETVPPGLAVIRRRELHDYYFRGTRLRLRLVDEAGQRRIHKLGQKVRLEADAPSTVAHTTMYLSADEAQALLTLPADELLKTRQLIAVGKDQILAVDVFHGALDGLVLAELDLGLRAATPMSLPLEPVAEVTGDERFTGGALARTGPDKLRQLLREYSDRSGDARQ
jgi:CYTH domain-containing protein